jgi:release factor glutamine methyltransferase
MTYQELWNRLTPLYDAGEAKAIARMVLESEFSMTLTDLYTGKVNELSAKDLAFLDDIFSRLEKGEPVQYVLGSAEFAGRVFHVEPEVLIPRPETAKLCQLAEEELQNSFPVSNTAYRVLDIGTGSGCIAITLALDLAEKGFCADVEAWDISDDALRIASGNASALDVRVSFEKHDVLHLNYEAEENNGEKTSVYEKKFNMIVSNPPYIADEEAKDMEKNVMEFEPHLALFVPNDDPLRFYRAIAEYGKNTLVEGGVLAFEMNSRFVRDMEQMLSGLGYSEIRSLKDDFGKYRYTLARRL